jgi:hypothetical protein
LRVEVLQGLEDGGSIVLEVAEFTVHIGNPDDLHAGSQGTSHAVRGVFKHEYLYKASKALGLAHTSPYNCTKPDLILLNSSMRN